MTDDTSENDNEFLAYFERLAPKCQTLSELITKTVKEILEQTPHGLAETRPQGQSQSYLERVNQMLLERLLKAEKPLTPDMSGALKEEPSKPQLSPVEEPKKPEMPPIRKPFWT